MSNKTNTTDNTNTADTNNNNNPPGPKKAWSTIGLAERLEILKLVGDAKVPLAERQALFADIDIPGSAFAPDPGYVSKVASIASGAVMVAAGAAAAAASVVVLIESGRYVGRLISGPKAGDPTVTSTVTTK